MGLDLVELVMAVEETFDVELPDSEAEKILTPAQLTAFISGKVQTAQQSVCHSRRAFHALRRLLIDDLGCRRNQVRPDTPLESLVPRADRRTAWQAMQSSLHAEDWPQLRRPPWVVAVLLAVFAVGAGAFVCAGLAYGLALAVAVVPWRLALAATRPLCKEFPKSCRTAGQLAYFLVEHAPKLFAPTGRVWTRAEVADTIRRLTIEQLGLTPEQYRPDARFIQDLGAG